MSWASAGDPGGVAGPVPATGPGGRGGGGESATGGGAGLPDPVIGGRSGGGGTVERSGFGGTGAGGGEGGVGGSGARTVSDLFAGMSGRPGSGQVAFGPALGGPSSPAVTSGEKAHR